MIANVSDDLIDISFEVKITLTEAEARALNALVGYGDNAFIGFFYRYLGEYYLQPYEHGLRSLFRSIRNDISPRLDSVDRARKLLGSIDIST